MPASYRPIAPRVSIAVGISRWLTSDWLILNSEAAIAASTVAASLPHVHVSTSLFGAFSCSCGAPGAVAFLASTTVGNVW